MIFTLDHCVADCRIDVTFGDLVCFCLACVDKCKVVTDQHIVVVATD